MDIEEFLNEDDLDMHVHKRLLEMAPDLFTSIGILGTFVGLVWGLKDFQPSDYEAMTSSVSSLVDGIKVGIPDVYLRYCIFHRLYFRNEE